MRISLNTIRSIYMRERNHIEVETLLSLESGHFPFTVPVKTSLPTSKESYCTAIVNGWRGHFTFRREVRHKRKNLLCFAIIQHQFFAVRREYLTAQLRIEGIKQAPGCHILSINCHA